MPIGYWSLWGQPMSVTSGDLRWPWNSCDARSRVTASQILTLLTSTNPIQFNRTTPSCVYSRFRWNLAEGCSLCDVITSWPDLTWPNFFHQKLRKGRPISYRKFQHYTPNGLACSSEKLMGGLHQPPLHWRGLKETSHLQHGVFNWDSHLVARVEKPCTVLSFRLKIPRFEAIKYCIMKWCLVGA